MDSARWQQAQAYEAAWWRSNVSVFDPRYLMAYAADIEQAVAPLLTMGPEVHVVEVGAGPVGIVPFVNGGRRVATDPLDPAFEANPTFSAPRTRARANGTEYVAAKGESLPFEDEAFDLYIADNVLDHVQSPARVLSEARRVLRTNGVAYVRVHVYHAWGRAVRWAMERAVIDKGHPHTFSPRSLIKMAREEGFEVIRSTRSPFSAGWKQDWSRAFSGNRKALVQAVLAVTRADHELVLQRRAA